jgi:hypothetical protein
VLPPFFTTKLDGGGGALHKPCHHVLEVPGVAGIGAGPGHLLGAGRGRTRQNMLANCQQTDGGGYAVKPRQQATLAHAWSSSTRANDTGQAWR